MPINVNRACNKACAVKSIYTRLLYAIFSSISLLHHFTIKYHNDRLWCKENKQNMYINKEIQVENIEYQIIKIFMVKYNEVGTFF